MKRLTLRFSLVPMFLLLAALSGGCAKRELTINATQREIFPDSSRLVDVYTAMGSDTLDFGTSRFVENNLSYAGRGGENLKLRVWYPAGRPVDTSRVILLIPGYGGGTVELFPLATEFARRGFVTAMLSPRGTDLNAGLKEDYGLNEPHDATDAINAYARRHNLTKPIVGVFGASLGGAIALNMALEDKRVAAIAVEGLPLDLETTAKRLLSAEELDALKSRYAGHEAEFRERSPEMVLKKPLPPIYAIWGDKDKLVTAEERATLRRMIEISTSASAKEIRGGGHSMRYGFPLTLSEAQAVNTGIADFLQSSIRY
ncbi:MAG: ABC-type multidrug transport system, ATPase component [Chlorobi bacterium]|nr:ABC-type multidrug transport system, ATPase component [Chlorobiota bacterium]